MSGNKKVAPNHNQKWIVYAGIAVALILLVFVIFRPTQTSQAYPAEVSPTQVSELQQNGAFLLDVREPSEWAAGHIDGATLIPLGELPHRLNEVPKDREIVVVCRTGRRSAEGRDILRNSGYTQSTSMAGGMNAWTSHGLPVKTGE